MNEKKIRTLFIVRLLLWIVAASATIYWIVWSFKLYSMGIYDVEEYATVLRPIIYTGLIIAFVCIFISYFLGKKSDELKREDDALRTKKKDYNG